MFGRLRDLDSWVQVARAILIGLSVLMLAPPVVGIAGLMLLLLSPVGLVAVPFMLWAFFGGSNHERQAAVQRHAWRAAAVSAT